LLNIFLYFLTFLPMTSKLFLILSLYTIYAMIFFNMYLNNRVKIIKLIHIKNTINLDVSFFIIKIKARINMTKAIEVFNTFINKLNFEIYANLYPIKKLTNNIHTGINNREILKYWLKE